MPKKIAHTKEELPKLQEGYVRVVHVTKVPEGGEYLEKIKEKGLDYKMYGMLSSVARYWQNENDVEYSIQGDPRFSGPEARAVVMDVPMEEIRLHDKITKAPGVVPAKYLVGIIDASEERKKSKLERDIGRMTIIISFLISIFFLSFNLTGNVISNLSLKTSNIIGLIFSFIGLVGGFFYFRNK